jgi:hypothetical protein
MIGAEDPDVPVLPDALPRRVPFEHALSRAAVGDASCEQLVSTFEAELSWVRHDTSFYHCWIAEITEAVEGALREALRRRVQDLLGVPLASTSMVTAQRMDPGDHATSHTDRPLLGYEAARVVLHLNRGWREADGGRCELLDAHAGAPVDSLPPAWDHAFVFLASPDSHHAVRPAAVVRRTAVFHFWHAGNTPELSRDLRAWFHDFRVADLPRALDAQVAEAEARVDDDLSLRAAAVAWSIARFGAEVDEVAAAYAWALDGQAPEAAPSASLALAAWIHELYTEQFDARRWAALAPRCAVLASSLDPLGALARRCFPLGAP